MKRFRTHGDDYRVRVSMPEHIPVSPMEFFSGVYEHIMSTVIDNIPEQDYVGLTMVWLALDRPVYMPFSRRRDVSLEAFLDKLERILQSNDTLSFQYPFTVSVTTVEAMHGNGKMSSLGKRGTAALDDFLDKKKSVVRIRNRDNMCLARALVVAIAYSDFRTGKITREAYAMMRRNDRPNTQTVAAKNLCEKAGVSTEHPCGVEEAETFQRYLKEYQIVIRGVECLGGIIYHGPPAPKELNVLYYPGHFETLTKLAGFMAKDYYCQECKRGYTDPKAHACRNVCKCCQKDSCVFVEWKFCADCGRWMMSDACFQKHLEKGRATVSIDRDTKTATDIPPLSTCDKIRVCQECLVTVRWKDKDDHVCGEHFCRLCKCTRDNNHLCFVPVTEDENAPRGKQQKKKKKKKRAGVLSKRVVRRRAAGDGCEEEDPRLNMDDSDFEDCFEWMPVPQENYSFVYYDFETSAHCPIPDTEDQYEHKVNFAAAQTVCNGCSRTQIGEEGLDYVCGCQQKVFSGDESLRLFCEWLMQQDGAIALAHNSSGFDGILIEKHLISAGIKLENAIFKGKKLMSAKIPGNSLGIRLIDSLNFIMSPLSSFSKMFGLSELRKGFFPHAFNVPANWDYEGPLPDASYYEPDSMGTEKRQEFLDWHARNASSHFNFRRELEAYCVSDVTLLKEGMGKFRMMFYELTRVDALRRCITIASAAIKTFTQNYLLPDSIGVIPRRGYTSCSRQSRVGLLWLKWWSHKNVAKVQHNSNGREFKVGNFMVDGWVEESNTALEFLGCHFHSCSRCYAPWAVNPLTGNTRKNDYERTMRRLQTIRETYGLNMITMWECDWTRERDSSAEIQTFMSAQHLTAPLTPYDALFGGRVNATVMYYECKEGEEIAVYDYISLYPYINKVAKYPLKHPTIITEGFAEDLTSYFGLIKCRVLAPEDLHLPVLPLRCNGRLMFPLCATCANELSQTVCRHGDGERSWDGTFVSEELKKALSVGYTVLRVYEIWHWDASAEYNSITKSGGLFTDYIKKFLKIKQEASGWPHGCNTETEKQAYLDSYYEAEGIRLDRDKIAPSSFRSVAKLLLNSLW